ncbi:MAG: cytosolic protein [bacterium]
MEQDSPWKDVVEDLFEAFLFFFFPDIHKDIDFAKGHQFLDKELQKIIKSSKTGKRYADKLVKVYLLDGSEKWLLIHIEIQGYEEKEFPERMFIYYYRIFDKFRRTVISLAVLTDDNPKFRPNEYCRAICGCEVIFRYPLVKIIDYRDRLVELEASPHPFAIIVRAYLKTLETKGNVRERYTWKKHFLLELYQRGMERETLLAIHKFIDWIMELPDELEAEINKGIETIEETTMPHMTSAQRIDMKRGLAKGIATVLELKFGEAGQPLSERTNKLIYKIKPPETFEKLMEQLKYARSLAEAEKLFDEVESQYQEVIV